MQHFHYQLIETAEELQRLCDRLASVTMLAVDTEADSLYHYREKVCLIQMAADGITAVVDPLKVGDMTPLAPLFADDRIVKVLHGADYDVRSLYRDFGIRINNLFDTELAGRFLGFAHTGLDAVLNRCLSVQVNKKFQKKDWSRRPLPAEMVEYAAEDVNYLIPLANHLIGELRRRGRLSWVRQECERLSLVRPAAANDHPLFLNFKGAGKLARRELAVLEALLQMRDRMAAEKDRPHFKIISNRALFELAMAQPRSLEALEKTRALSRLQTRRYGHLVVAAVSEGLAVPEAQLPAYPRKRGVRLPAAALRRVKALKNWRDHTAATLDIDPARLITKSAMHALALQRPANVADLARVAELHPWQVEHFGRQLLAALAAAD